MNNVFLRIIMSRIASLAETIEYEQRMQAKVNKHRDFPNSRLILVAIAYSCIRYALSLGSWDESLHELAEDLRFYCPNEYDKADASNVYDELVEREQSNPTVYYPESKPE